MRWGGGGGGVRGRDGVNLEMLSHYEPSTPEQTAFFPSQYFIHSQLGRPEGEGGRTRSILLSQH